MVINDKKTQLMFINSKLKRKELEEEQVDFAGAMIKHQKTLEILGGTLSDDMKWDEHLWKGKQCMNRSIRIKASLIRTIKPYVSLKTLGQVGGAMINSTIMYAAPLWGATTASNINKVQAAQVKAARIITGCWNTKDKPSHRQDVLDQLNWPNVRQIIHSATLNLLKASIESKSSEGMNSLFKVTLPNNKTRNKSIRVDHNGSLSKGCSSFSSNATTMYNNLAQVMKNPGYTIKKFKKELKLSEKSNNILHHH